MGAIAIANCTVTAKQVDGLKYALIVTPAATAADTLDVSTIFGIGCFAICSNETDHSALVAAQEYDDLNLVLPGAAAAKVYSILAFGE